MNTKEVRKLLDLFAAFANATSPTEIIQLFDHLIRTADRLKMYVGLPGRVREKGGPIPKFKKFYSEQVPPIVILECLNAVRFTLKAFEMDKYFMFLFSPSAFLYNGSDKMSEFFFADENSKDGTIKANYRLSLQSVMALSMHYANTKGVSRCEVCKKYIINHTGHKKKTCSVTCRQRKRRAELKLKGE